jgi:hypothetical protein
MFITVLTSSVVLGAGVVRAVDARGLLGEQ